MAKKDDALKFHVWCIFVSENKKVISPILSAFDVSLTKIHSNLLKFFKNSFKSFENFQKLIQILSVEKSLKSMKYFQKS